MQRSEYDLNWLLQEQMIRRSNIHESSQALLWYVLGCVSSLALTSRQIQDYLEREQSLLVAAYNALNRTLSFVVEARAMEAVLRLLLVEITESFSAPPPTKIDLSQSTAVQSPTIPELIKLASTALSQYQKQSTPILDHSDLLLAIDRVNSDWGERLGSIDDTRTSM